MAGKYFPFRSVLGDRKYSAEDWAAYFALFIGNGVFYSSADKLRITEGEGMKVKVQKGAGFIAGRMYLLEEDITITLDTADGALNRIDRIVLRCDYTNRLIEIDVLKGSYSKSPTAPELTRNVAAYELALADVYVAAGVIKITAANITDQRLNTSLCGIVTGLVQQADTQEIFDEFYAYLQEFKQITQVDIENWTEEQKQAYTDWYTAWQANMETWTIEQKQAYIDWYTTQQQNFAAWYNSTTDQWEKDVAAWFEEVQRMLEGDVGGNLANKITLLEETKAERVLFDEDAQAAGVEEPQGYELCIKSGALCVRRVV